MKQTGIVAMCLVVSLGLVLAAPQRDDSSGCYWTECKSLFTYDYKCPVDERQVEINESATSGCGKGLAKYQCCPGNDASNVPSAQDASSSSPPKPVVPVPV
jgi:hypothetical protein